VVPLVVPEAPAGGRGAVVPDGAPVPSPDVVPVPEPEVVPLLVVPELVATTIDPSDPLEVLPA